MKEEISDNNNHKDNKPFSDSVASPVDNNTFQLTVNEELRQLKVHPITINRDRATIKVGEIKVEIDIENCENAFDLVKQVEIELANNGLDISPRSINILTNYLEMRSKSINKILKYFKEQDS
ncbi:MAG: hypothetical protein P0116_15010, partial [Candidatus Nitrosocosmicus sp.]|nr:hypothetical protein [Candidatus Nitrosocosmicus sp.]